MERPVPHPPFSWSHSRDRTLLECARAYFWRYYGGHGGWLPDASPEARLAYAVKHLTTYPMVLGTAVHDCARDCVVATRNRAPRPTVEAMLARVSSALNRTLLGSHRRGAFLRDPKRVPMLRDMWYTGRQDSAALVAAIAKARICLRTLSGSGVWEEIEACRREWVAVADSPEAFVHEGWPVYAGPDAVYRPEGRYVVIVDWKTGDETDAELQIALYALYCRKALGMRFREGEWFGRTINLATGSDTVSEISRLELLRAAERIRDSVGAMHALLVDAQTNVPRPVEDFPLVPRHRRDQCSRCEFFALCEAELSRADGLLT